MVNHLTVFCAVCNTRVAVKMARRAPFKSVFYLTQHTASILNHLHLTSHQRVWVDVHPVSISEHIKHINLIRSHIRICTESQPVACATNERHQCLSEQYSCRRYTFASCTLPAAETRRMYLGVAPARTSKSELTQQAHAPGIDRARLCTMQTLCQ